MYSRATIAFQYLKTWLVFDVLLILLDSGPRLGVLLVDIKERNAPYMTK